MGKRCFNNAWLDKVDAKNQVICLWCMKKDDDTASCKLCSKDISTESMGFSAWKQHSEKQKHRALTCVDASTEGTSNQQSVLSQCFLNLKSTKPSVTNEIPSSSAGGGGWTVKELATKAEEIIATMLYAAQNIPFSNAENLSACYEEQFHDSLIAKNVSIGLNKMSYVVRYALGPYFTQLTVKDIVEGKSFHITIWWNSHSTSKETDGFTCVLMVWKPPWSQGKIPYFTNVWASQSCWCGERDDDCTRKVSSSNQADGFVVYGWT